MIVGDRLLQFAVRLPIRRMPEKGLWLAPDSLATTVYRVAGNLWKQIGKLRLWYKGAFVLVHDQESFSSVIFSLITVIAVSTACRCVL